MSVQAIQVYCHECNHRFPLWECGNWSENPSSRCKACTTYEQTTHACPRCDGEAYVPELTGIIKVEMMSILEEMIATPMEESDQWDAFMSRLYDTWWFVETKETIQACYLAVRDAPHKKKQSVIGMLENWYLAVPYSEKE